jgi:hypothetical protein
MARPVTISDWDFMAALLQLKGLRKAYAWIG